VSENEKYSFQWKDLGDIKGGRPNLGGTMSVAVYRLMQYTLRDVMVHRISAEHCSSILREAGELAGREFCRNILDCSLPFNGFTTQLQEKLLEFKIGILRFEKSDPERMEFMLTVDEDLDCSGLPPTGETVCEYDEGFLAGVLGEYTGRKFDAREIDCWAAGERTCRFKVVPAP
jgi:predicted hydrocarbon binding protein